MFNNCSKTAGLIRKILSCLNEYLRGSAIVIKSGSDDGILEKLQEQTTTMTSSQLPLFLKGEVIKGFGRGSKELGCPTANYPLSVVQSLPPDFVPGVYYGWAQVNDGPVYKMVANIGWCPFYGNSEKSVETHILHKFDDDFYGANLKVCIAGYIRGEKNFDSLNGLIEEIKNDISTADQLLEKSHEQSLKNHSFFAR